MENVCYMMVKGSRPDISADSSNADESCREERNLCVLMQVPTDVEKCQDRVECFNADLKADWERWQNNKRQDFRQLLTGMADKNIQYYEKVKDKDIEYRRE